MILQNLLILCFQLHCIRTLFAAETAKLCKSVNPSKSNDALIYGFNDNYVWSQSPDYNKAQKDFILTHLESPKTPKESIMVISKYRKCKKETTNCNCAIVIRVQDEYKTRYAYIDVCDKDLRLDSDGFVALDYSSGSSHTRIDCSSLLKKPTDWDLVPISFDTFQCAAKDNQTYMLRVFRSLTEKSSASSFSSTDKRQQTSDLPNLEVAFNLKPAVHSSASERDELKEVVLTLDENTNAENTLCGPYFKSNQSVTLKGPDINTEDQALRWDFLLKANLLQTCDLENHNQYIYTFVGKRLNKTEAFKTKKTYVLYDDGVIRVTTKFKRCDSGTGLCHCAVAVETSDGYPRYVFIDGCEASEDVNKKFKYYDRQNRASLKSGKLPLLGCEAYEIDDVNDESQWTQLSPIKTFFKCARLVEKNRANDASTCETYVLEANTRNRSIRLKVVVSCANRENDSYLSSIQLIPSKTIGDSTGGICGKVNLYPCSGTHSNDCVAYEPTQTIEETWTLNKNDSKWELDLSSFVDSYSCNHFNYEKMINSFDKNSILKTSDVYEIASPLILYDHNLDVMVYGKFKLCKKTPRNAYCMCSVYMRVNNEDPEFAFIDLCLAQYTANLESPLFKFRHFKTPDDEPEELNCDSEVDDENSESEWASVPTSFGYFKCAKLNDPCKKYIIRTINTEKNIQIQVDVSCPQSEIDYLSQIIIKPALKAESFTKGLCGYWYDNGDNGRKNVNFDVGSMEKALSIGEKFSQNSIKSYEENDLLPKNLNLITKSSDLPPSENKTISETKFCNIQNDPHVWPIFSNKDIEFQEEGDYVLYYTKETIIAARFYKDSDRNVTLICGIYFASSYKGDNKNFVKMELFDYCKEKTNLRFNGNELILKCDPSKDEKKIISDPFNNYEWYITKKEGRDTFIENFDCSLKDHSTYYIKISYSNKKYQRHETLIEFRIVSMANTIEFIKIYPSNVAINYADDDYSGGVCGPSEYNRDLWYDEYKPEILKTQNDKDKPSPSKEFVEYWSLCNFLQKCPKRKAPINGKKNQLFYERYQKKLLRNYKEDEAVEICTGKLDNQELVLSENFEHERKKLIEMCIADIQLSGDKSWADVHWSSLEEKYLSMILEDRANFDKDNLIKDEVLALYKINCPNDCSGNGKCFKNPKCTYGFKCDSVVLCDCKQSFGSSDCSVSLSNAIDFEIVETCCDTRTMNCEKITGVGERFSDNNALYYTMRVIQDSIQIKYLTNVVETVFKNSFEIAYPFGLIPEIKRNSITIMFGLSYTSFTGDEQQPTNWKNITFFDSKCRTCNNGVLNEALLQGTCLTKNSKVCSELKSGKCPEMNPCSGAFDLGLILQSSDNSTDKQFDMLKNSFSEVVGRLRVGPNQVHVGFMQYSQLVKTYASVRLSEQGSVGLLIDRLQDLFYVPFEFSPIEDALKKSINEIFGESSRAYKVPRVAVLVNDAASNPKANLSLAAQNLAKQGIEVIAIGIGKNVDVNELRVVTNGNEQNILRLSGYESLYANLDAMVQKICSFNVEIPLNQLVFQRLDTFDYRYFRTSLLGLKTNFIEIQIEELQVNTNVNCYYSFTVKNPFKENSGRLVSSRQTARVIDDESIKLISNRYLIYVPTGQPEVFFTLESLNKGVHVNVMVEEIDF